ALATFTVTQAGYPPIEFTAATTERPLPPQPPRGPIQDFPDPLWAADIAVTLAVLQPFPVRVVSDANGAPITGAEGSLNGCASGGVSSRRTRTDAAGDATLPLPPGEYQFYVQPPNFWRQSADGATVYADHRDSVSIPAAPPGPRVVRLEPCCTMHAEVV